MQSANGQAGKAGKGGEDWSGLEELRSGLRGFLSSHCYDENEIDDVIQETLFRAARYRVRLANGERLRSWAIRISLNVLYDTRRRTARAQGASDSEEILGKAISSDLGPEDCVEEPVFPFERWTLGKEEALAHLGAAVGELREADRQVLGAFYGGGESCRETGVVCCIPAHLVKVRLFRARQRLAAALRRRIALGKPEIEEVAA